MKEFLVDFSGYMKIKADSKEEAARKFWNFIANDINLSTGDLSDDVWEIFTIKEITDRAAC